MRSDKLEQQFLNPMFELENIDRYFVRRAIKEGIIANQQFMQGKLLDVGCGVMPYKSILTKPSGFVDEYIGLDFELPLTPGYGTGRPDIFWDGKKIPLGDNSVDSILLTEVLEHCFHPELVMSECYRVLKSEGSILITVPFLWPLHDIPYDAYRYTPFSIEKILKSVGFVDIKINALGGWNASLGQMLGLWLNRSGIEGWRRKFLYVAFFKYFIKWLYKNDQKPTNFYDDSYMITGLITHAKK